MALHLPSLVEELAAQRYAHLKAIDQAMAESGLCVAEEALLEAAATAPDALGEELMSAGEAFGKLPCDFSPARLRCMRLAGELYGQSLAAGD